MNSGSDCGVRGEINIKLKTPDFADGVSHVSIYKIASRGMLAADLKPS